MPVVMESRLPELGTGFSRTVGLTVEILRQAALAASLSDGIAELASQFGPDVGDRVYVRIPIGEGWLEGWYAPIERELEPIAWVPAVPEAA